MYTIQKNVPQPKIVRSSAVSRRKYPFDDMEVSDMFFVPHKDKNTLTTHASTVGKKLGRKFKTRVVHMHKHDDEWYLCDADAKNAVRGIAVWRVA